MHSPIEPTEARGGAMEDVSNNATHAAAHFMLEVFASVGAAKFDLTLTTFQGEKESFRRAVPIERLNLNMPGILDRATSAQLNVIIRPVPPPVFLQLDDLDSAACDRVQNVSFLVLETSPNNFQAWIAMSSVVDRDFVRRLKRGIGADLSASGATRIAGSFNYKEKYRPDFPQVAIHYANPVLVVEPGDLVEYLSPPSCSVARPNLSVRSPKRNSHRWPDYARCVAGAPPNNDKTGADISRADFTFCMIAIDWGWSIEDTANRLVTESVKAKENGLRYAVITAERAGEAVSRKHV